MSQLRSGGEYLLKEFSDHLKKASTTRRLTAHDTLEHNGIAKRANHTNPEMVRAMLHDSGLPKFLWAKALSQLIYLRNQTWMQTIGNTTPYELLNGKKPNLEGLQLWGCKVHVHDTSGSKLDGHSRVGRWMGFDPDTKDGHRIYWPEKRAVSVERSIKFNFTNGVVIRVPPLKGETVNNECLPIPTTDEPTNTPAISNIDTPDVAQPPDKEGRGKRVRKETEYVRMLREGTGITGQRSGVLPKGIQVGSSPKDVVDVESVVEEHAMVTVVESGEGLMPTYEEAHRRLDWPKWNEAIQKELDSLKRSDTWELVKRPAGTNIVDCQWVLHIKKNAQGKIEKYKAQLVAKGFTQIYRINYYETYTPVAKLTSF